MFGNPNDWRYLQGLVFTYNPRFANDLSIGFIRWVQFYSDIWLMELQTIFSQF